MRLPRLACVLSISAAATLSPALSGQQLLKDINTAESFGGWSLPAQFTEAAGRSFFVADDGRYGAELHLTDGTLLGTRLVRDIWPGPGGGGPRGLRAIQGRVVFLAFQPQLGTLPYGSDGTFDGTRPLRSDLTSNDDPVAAAGTVFLLANHPATGTELWKTDGTQLGTVLVRDIVPGPGQPQISFMVAHQTMLVFVVTSQTTGSQELWSSDGTLAGTVQRVILPSSAGTAPTAMVSDGTRVWLLAVSGSGEALYRSDLTGGGTALVTTLPSGTGASDLTTVGTRLFFKGNDLINGTELWTSDGTAAGTRLVKDILPGPGGSDPRHLVSFNNELYFAADNGSVGRELWRSNGTTAGTTLVKDTGAGGLGFEPEAILAHGGRLVFGASGQLWRSTGTTAGTVPITAFAEQLTSVGWVRPFGVGYLFSAMTNSTGQEPWITDLTGGGTMLLKDVNSPPGQGSNPMELAPLGADVLFLANDNTGSHLWRSNGSSGGTTIVVPSPNAFFWLTPFGNRVLITGAFGTGLFVTDGTPAGTVEVSPNGGFTRALRPVIAGGLAYFPATTGAAGEELWVTNGSAGGTRLLRDINPGANASQISDLTAVGNRVFFTADNGVAGRELWVSDGTTAGTVLVLDLTPGAASSMFAELTAVGSRVFFSAYTLALGFELGVSDGTAAGTQIVDLEPGVNSSSPFSLAAFQGQIYFAASHSGQGVTWGLWRSNGTLAGTALVHSEPAGLLPLSVVASGNQLFFTGNSANEGRELWVSNGTTAGTRMVKDLTPGFGNTQIDHLRSLGSGLVVFTAADPAFASEPWRSDGTNAGTFILADLATGAIGSDPDQYTLVGQLVFFTADDRLIGREPYVMPRNASGGASVESLGIGCARSGAAIPTLGASSLPQLGNSGLRLLLDHAEPSSPASLLFAAQTASIPLGGGCTLLLAPPIPITVSFGTTPIGTADLPLPVPNTPALIGLSIAIQGVVVQAGAPFLGVISLTQALRLRFGP